MSIKKWVVSPLNKEHATKLAEEWEIPFFLAMMLEIRGITDQKQIETFFQLRKQPFDPYQLIDMDRAVACIQKAVDRFEKICVYGDYDADGVTSTALLYSYLESCGANVMYYIPQRESEGYGMNREAIQTLKEQGVDLLITVDNGIASLDEVAYANQLGMRVVITDHHMPQGTLPAAEAVVDPHREDCPSTFKDWAGVGVAFQLISALEGEDGDQESLWDNYADLVCVGTIGDIVPLHGENRTIVQAGLRDLSNTDRIGLKALLEESGLSGKKLSAGNISFTIVPRINALGRLGASDQAVRLLLSDYSEEAESLALQMGQKNQERQQIEADILSQVSLLLEKEPWRKHQRVIVAEGEGWHEGVIGIVASRIVEKYGKPCFILSVDGEEAKGSGRSVPGFSLYDAVSACKEHLTRFGGHPMAAGVSLRTEEIDAFRKAINQYASDLPDDMPDPVLRIDCKLNPAALSVDLVSQLSSMEPFGAGNPTPIFGLYQMTLSDICPVGGGKHLRLTFHRRDHTVTAMRFQMRPEDFPYRVGDILDLAVTLEKSEFRGKESLSVYIREMKLSSFHEEAYLKEKSWYEAVLRGETLEPSILDGLIPSREDFAVVYRFLRAQKGWNYGLEVLCSRLQDSGIGCAKLLVILAMMQELHLMEVHLDGDLCRAQLLEVAGKVDLNSSQILTELRQKRGSNMSSRTLSEYKPDRSYEELVLILTSSERSFDMEQINKAYQFALTAHGDQKRRSGVPYIVHPISVAYILVELGMDTESVVAALLHDVVEDTETELETVRKLFGEEVANLTNGVTKLGKIPYSSREEQQAENLRKMLIAMADDIRVIIIKLADRLHNMRTIEFMPEQKRRDKALETMEVYAPIAHRLGIRAVKEELEDRSLRCLDPIAYNEIENALALKSADREDFICAIKERIIKRVSPMIPNVYLEGRVKSINGIYRKVFVQGKSMESIYDIFAVRVIVDTVNDCYNVLGIVHDMFRPLPNRFKDYISTPKPNLYQSLHTTVIAKEGIPFEVQIRTWEMHYTAEYGIAAHWKYKLGLTKSDAFEQRLVWIRQMLENQQDNEDATDLVRTIKSDLAPEEVFVFTPRGDVISLPMGATVIDFAYAIHSAVGNRMIGAKADKRIVPIDYKVKTGEIVEVLTTKEVGHGPSRDWLKIVKTSEARNKIRQWFKKEKRDENILEGRGELEREFRRNNITLPDAEMKVFLEAIAKRQHYGTIEDLFAAIGYGGVQLWRIMPRIKEEFGKLVKPQPQPVTEIKQPLASNKASSGVVIEGIDNCLIKFSKCCNPLPGDDIIGFITRGYGVSIHKRNCSNVPRDIASCQEPARWVKAHWAGEVKEEFKSTLEIVATNRTGLLADITIQLSNMHIFIHALNSREAKDNHAIIYATITVNGLAHLKTVMAKLSNINGILSIGRS